MLWWNDNDRYATMMYHIFTYTTKNSSSYFTKTSWSNHNEFGLHIPWYFDNISTNAVLAWFQMCLICQLIEGGKIWCYDEMKQNLQSNCTTLTEYMKIQIFLKQHDKTLNLEHILFDQNWRKKKKKKALLVPPPS